MRSTMKRYLLLLIVAALSIATTSASELDAMKRDSLSQRGKFLPTRGRIDRKIVQHNFVYMGEVMLGLTGSYGNIKSADSDIMLLVDNINIGLKSATVKPFFACAYHDNLVVGVRFGYDHISGEVGSLDLNIGLLADMENMGISNIGLRNESYSWSFFHRNYLGLDRRGIVGVIMEAELQCKTGTTTLWSGVGEERTKSDTRNFSARLNFNPGLAIYVMPQVCVTVTVGVGGLYYNSITQYDMLGVQTGFRNRTGLNFRLNLADIQVGIVAHLWNSKKK